MSENRCGKFQFSRHHLHNARKGKAGLGADHHEVKGVGHAALKRRIAPCGHRLQNPFRQNTARKVTCPHERDGADASLLSAEKERGRNAESEQRFEEQKDAERTRARETGLGEEERRCLTALVIPGELQPKASGRLNPFRQRLDAARLMRMRSRFFINGARQSIFKCLSILLGAQRKHKDDNREERERKKDNPCSHDSSLTECGEPSARSQKARQQRWRQRSRAL